MTFYPDPSPSASNCLIFIIISSTVPIAAILQGWDFKRWTLQNVSGAKCLCHIFSIRFKSGDSADIFHQLILWSMMESRAKLEVCLGSLSCMKQCDLGNFAWMNGTSVWSRISVNWNLSIIPSQMQIPVRPFLEIPAHTWTLQSALLYKDNKVYAHLYKLHVSKKMFRL